MVYFLACVLTLILNEGMKNKIESDVIFVPRKEKPENQIIGKRYGKLVVIDITKKQRKSGKRTDACAVCRCDCGNITIVRIFALNSSNTKSCGCMKADFEVRKTRSAILRRIPIEDWDGFLTTDSMRGRVGKRYDEWRRAVYERDNYTCRCCGCKKGGSLEAHHIYSFSEYKKLRYDVNNGITLCKNCHSNNIKGSFHNTYGTKNNTPDQ